MIAVWFGNKCDILGLTINYEFGVKHLSRISGY